MEELEKSIRVSSLFALYGKLLPLSQEKSIHLYYDLDLSLSEIAEEEGVSRNAVYDALTKGIKTLESYEDKLHLLKNKEEFNLKLKSLKDKLKEEDYFEVLNTLQEED